MHACNLQQKIIVAETLHPSMCRKLYIFLSFTVTLKQLSHILSSSANWCQLEKSFIKIQGCDQVRRRDTQNFCGIWLNIHEQKGRLDHSSLFQSASGSIASNDTSFTTALTKNSDEYYLANLWSIHRSKMKIYSIDKFKSIHLLPRCRWWIIIESQIKY